MTASSDRWTFGVDPLPQALALAPLLRRVQSLVLALEQEDPAVERLLEALRDAEAALGQVATTEVAPRLGIEAPATRRPYVDHARHIGAYNPCFPEYAIEVDGEQAAGSVEFPIVYEGPPGVVHGGVLATFFDCVIQHHNCDVGVAGKTASLSVQYRRPVPLGRRLSFTISRSAGDRRVTSHAELLHDGELLCRATMETVVGNRAELPVVPARGTP